MFQGEHLSLKPLFGLFLSGRLRPVLLYSAGPVTALNGSRSNGIRQIDFVIFVIQYLTLYSVNMNYNLKLEDLKVLRRSPDLLNNVKKVEGQLHLITEQILFYHIWDLQPFWSSDLNNLMNNPSNSPVISEKKMFR